MRVQRPPGRRAAITPRGIAQGRGDAYLIALNRAISEWGGLIYVRPMAEMNNPNTLYSPTAPNGRSRGPEHAPEANRDAVCRISVILRGGTAAQTTAELRRQDLPPISTDLPVNPPSKLRVIWNPIAGIEGPYPLEAFYPGDRCVDVIGNDLFASSPSFSRNANEALYRFARAHGKPFAIPETGLTEDVPEFIRYLCDFVRRSVVEVFAYFESVRGSRYDLGDKPESRREYRNCIAPLGKPPPPAPKPLPSGARSEELLRLDADPREGEAPLDVTFTVTENFPRDRPIVQWQLVFGDGAVVSGRGSPPETLTHTYAREGVYDAVLIVYLAPPFTGTAIRFLTRARVSVGEDADVLLALRPDRPSGRAPLKVVFQAIANVPRPIVRWELLYGDGGTNQGTGKPPRFHGHTYTARGVFRAVLIVHLPSPAGTLVRLVTYADVGVT